MVRRGFVIQNSVEIEEDIVGLTNFGEIAKLFYRAPHGSSPMLIEFPQVPQV